MHHHYEFPGVKLLPSTYFKRQMGATFVYEPEGVEPRPTIRPGRAVVDGFPAPGVQLAERGAKIEKQFAGVPEDEVHAITWENGARTYGIA